LFGKKTFFWCPSKIPGKLGLGGPLPSFLEEHEVLSSSIERNARKNVVNSPKKK